MSESSGMAMSISRQVAAAAATAAVIVVIIVIIISCHFYTGYLQLCTKTNRVSRVYSAAAIV